jgi:hypothetical protein
MAAKATNKLSKEALDKMLRRAVLKADAHAAQRALAAGADADQVVLESAGWTPLLVYAAPNSFAITALLLKHGAQVDAPGPFGMTALHMAGRSPQHVEALLAAGADPSMKNDEGDTPLHFALNCQTAQLLIAKGADPNARNDAGLLTWQKISNLITTLPWPSADVKQAQIAIAHIQSVISHQNIQVATGPAPVTLSVDEQKARTQGGRI